MTVAGLKGIRSNEWKGCAVRSGGSMKIRKLQRKSECKVPLYS